KWPMDKVYWVMPVSGLILVWYSVMNIIDNYRKRNFH
ncbi:TRAP transporter small permease, partial [Escherichia coli]|nr:TRAP transporter small permease [Escherichia coli]